MYGSKKLTYSSELEGDSFQPEFLPYVEQLRLKVNIIKDRSLLKKKYFLSFLFDSFDKPQEIYFPASILTWVVITSLEKARDPNKLFKKEEIQALWISWPSQVQRGLDNNFVCPNKWEYYYAKKATHYVMM